MLISLPPPSPAPPSSFFFSSRRRHTRSDRDWSSDVCSSDLPAGAPYRGADALDAGRTIDTQLLLEMEVGGCDEDMDALALRRLQRFRGSIDVAIVAARQRGDDGTPDRLGHLLDAAQIAV